MRFGHLTPSMWIKSWKFQLIATLGMALLSGCSSTPKPVPPVALAVTIQANPKINPDTYGRPSPTKVVFYELKSSVAFETADFFSLSQKDQATLGGDLLGKEEFFLRPGETKNLTRKGFPETTALGVFVEFRDIDKSIWHATAVVPAPVASGMFDVFSSNPNQKNYQILIDQHSVKFVAATATPASTTTVTPTTTPTITKPAVPN